MDPTTTAQPQKFAENNDFVTISRGDYEEFLHMKKFFRIAKPTKSEQKIIAQGRKDVARKNYRSWPFS